MKAPITAALALAAATSLPAQTALTIPNLDTATVMTGNWSWTQTADGSQVVFLAAGASTVPQVTIRCARATRRVTIAKPASSSAPSLGVWTSEQKRSLPARFDAATGLLSADLAATDPLLDAMALSRGRLGFTVSGAAPLVLPSWPEVTRIVEDCRA